MEKFLYSINVYDYERFRDRVVEKCNVSRSAWSNWRNGGNVDRKFHSIIDEIATDMFGRAVFGEGGAE